MAEKTTTVKMQEDGRVTIPANARKALGINGEERYLEVTIHVEE
jgi:bifunctional DNA-binding transcriptional regulator/antitoxin component of YhaV-PrlF toxin-antitoxin module